MANPAAEPLRGLPAPASLRPLRDAMFTDSDRRKPGADYEATLPNSRVAPSGSALTLIPAVDGTAAPLADYAFGIYNFVLPGYGDNAVIRLSFTVGPEIHDNLWVALANHGAGRWDIFGVGENGTVDALSLLPYIEQDNLYMAVLAGGSAPFELAMVTVGEDVIPVALLEADPDNGTVPLSVGFSAEGSSDEDGSIAKYEFDLDGDGSFETDNGSDPLVQFVYADAGSYTLRLRVTDDMGATSEDSVTVSANDPAMVPPVADLIATPPDGDAPLQVTLDAGGSTDDIAIVSYDWDVDGDGTFELLGTLDSQQVTTYEAGIWNPVVRVRDADGATDTATAAADSNASPTVDLIITPVCGQGERTYDASGSFEDGGTIVSYEWDFEADGTYDETTSVPVTTHTLNWGVYSGVVRVTDDDGEQLAGLRGPVHVTSWETENDAAVTGAGVAAAGLNGQVALLYEDSGDLLRYYRPESMPPFVTVSTGKNPPNTSRLALTWLKHSNGQEYPVAIYYASDGDLVCSRSLSHDPENEGFWVTHNIDSSSSNFSGDYGISVLTSGEQGAARLRVCYYDEDDGELYFAFSENSTPDEESDWTRHIVGTPSSATDDGRYNAMIDIDGLPRICYSHDTADFTNEGLIYSKATQSFPDSSDDWSGFFLGSSPTDSRFKGISLARVNGSVGVSYTVDAELRYKYHTAHDPGFSGWSATNTITTNVGVYTALIDLGNVPFIAYSQGVKFQVKARTAWAHSAAPDSPDDWCIDSNINPDVTSMDNGFITLSQFNGLPLAGIQTDEDAYSAARMVWGL